MQLANVMRFIGSSRSISRHPLDCELWRPLLGCCRETYHQQGGRPPHETAPNNLKPACHGHVDLPWFDLGYEGWIEKSSSGRPILSRPP